ncbi:hypothetical protein ACODT5_03570 [Streptomyces sp. 5.8]|uniref:hypothetical protein n=1 Tax=Streptomyces sp. 5.8 TaxID=3406571 RepID=UPI003BB7183C
MRYRTGLDPDVYAHVLATPGARALIARTAVQLQALADEVASPDSKADRQWLLAASPL